MSLNKEEFDKSKTKAQDRITEWIANVKTAGITRLQDRYGQVFKRIEWKPEEKDNAVVKKGDNSPGKSSKGKCRGQSKTQDAGKSTRKKTSKERNKSRNRSRHTPENRRMKTPESRCKSRMTPDSRNKDNMSSLTDFRHNKSSHNRSSYDPTKSVCSMDAISLLCDDESGVADHMTVLRKYYNKDRKSGADILVVEPDWIDRKRKKERMKLEGITENNHSKPSVTQTQPNRRGSILDENLLISRQRRIKKLKREKKNKKSEKITEETEIQDPTIQPPTFLLNIDKGQVSSRPTNLKSTVSALAPSIQMSRAPSQAMLGEEGALEIPSVQLRTNSSLLIGTPNPSNVSIQRPASAVRVQGFVGLSTGLDIVGMVKKQRSERRLAAKKSQMLAAAKTKKESEQREGTPKNKESKTQEKLRRYMRKIMNVLTLLRVTQRKVKGDMRAERRIRKKRKPPVGKEHLTFDPNYYKAATTTYGGLSLRARTVLWKQPGHRTEEDVHTLMEVMYRLPFFTKYSRSVKEELARVMWYDEFENGRVIIRQGDPGSRMYFVVSGGAVVQRTEIDPRTNSKIVQHLRDLSPGATFGELALLRNISRTFTVVCKGESGFLSLSKDEFNNVLRKDYEESWNDRCQFLRDSKHLKRLTEEQIKQCTDMSEIRTYEHNKLILGDVTELAQVVYFVKNGKCALVKKVEMIRSQSPYRRPNLFLPEMNQIDVEKFMDKPYGRKHRKIHTETHFLTVLTLFPGDYFGIGENLKDLFVVAKGKVECVLLNAIIFGLNWQENERLKQEREDAIPSNVELYRRYEGNRRWLEYKKGVVSDVMRRHSVRPNPTTYTDVPEPLVLQPSIPFDLIHYDN